MTGEGVERQQGYVRREHKSGDTEAESAAGAVGCWPDAGIDDVGRQQDEKDEREVEKIAMQILEQKQVRLAAIVVATRLTDGAGGWIEKEGAIVGLAIVVAGHTKAAGSREDQKRGRNPLRQPGDDDERREERREQVRVLRQLVSADAEVIVGVVDCTKCGVDAEGAESDCCRQRPEPPCVSSLGCAEPSRASSSPDRCHL